MLGSACDALYVALQGTKSGTDLLTDLNFWFNPVWEDADEQLLVSILIIATVCASWHWVTCIGFWEPLCNQ